MSDPDKRKDLWEKISAITPMVVGLCVTGLGVVFTHAYNNNQLKLAQIEALDKLRPLLTSEKPEEREFGYQSFVALGYEEMAIRVIRTSKDQSGRDVLLEIKKTASPELQVQADAALSTLDAARGMTARSEFGNASADPQQAAEMRPFEIWGQEKARQLGISSALGLAILIDTALNSGQANAQKIETAVEQQAAPPYDTREKERVWAARYLDERERRLRESISQPAILAALLKRVELYRGRLKDGDWDLKRVDAAPAVAK